MSTLLIGEADPYVMWCLRPAVEQAREWADDAGLAEVGLVVGAPSASEWAEICAMERVVHIVGGHETECLYEAPTSAKADVVCAATAADLLPAGRLPGVRMVIGLPGPQGPPPPPGPAGAIAKVIARACRRAVPPVDHREVSIVSGQGSAVAAGAVAGWTHGLPVVALSHVAAPPILASGGALVASGPLLGFEAVKVLATSSALRRALARKGRDAVEQMPPPDRVAETIAEAMVAAGAASRHGALSR